ncbi:DNA repair protein RadA [Leptolyngbya sp. FACHB-711]|uniref:DNA repair protein RadA n=1 Tax=unclassified Leptolyngbya TaxID=2650499 RepID=UPI0016866793|nr:DNA repair protein RadA [Leptolyngbya sp. FACHB-711]MBD1853882.1 DNA repair protein RadA [Cyanobacteria bacterium FACHB-502]MBD2024317.1 DNA repair protein RadA [Leptolyngbya sp. FACHB-711]
MPKPKKLYVCNACGGESLQHFGRCPNCGEWDTLVEQVVAAPAAINRRATAVAARNGSRSKTDAPQAVASLTFAQIHDHPRSRISSGYGELDRVLGGGIVPGSLVLIGGDPGIGKSTLLLQVANQLAQRHRTLYVCAEESGQQVKLRSQRLGIGLAELAEDAQPIHPKLLVDDSPRSEDADLYLLPEIDMQSIVRELESLRPQVAIIDSIQAIYDTEIASAPGSVSQVRECTSALMQVAKRDHITLFIVGHVTKEGAIAGPKVLEHLVDTVLYFEGDRFASHRLLRSVKNRFGATHELGVFEMADRGLEEVRNPSELFLGNRDEQSPGTATIVACEGTRPLVVELQALVSPTSYTSPRRSTTGLEYNRLLQILAVLEKRVGIPLSKLDAYVASSGGLNVAEPAADLGVAVAIAASFRDRVVDPETVVIGEVGLGGQIRPVSQMEPRLKEAAKLGFKRAIIPSSHGISIPGMEIVSVSRVVDAITAALVGSKS